MYAIRAKLLSSTVLYKQTRKDIKHPFYIRIPSTDIPTFEQIFLNQEYDFLVEKQPEVIIDAGANIGLASIYFANKFPDTKIIAIEPEKDNFELLKTNIAPYPNIIPIQAALWGQIGEINLVDSGLGSWAFTTEEKGASSNSTSNLYHKVRAITVDQIIKDYKLTKIDILKIDIEGAEKEVFMSSKSWIDRVDALIIELHEHIKPGCNQSFYNASKSFNNEWQQGENVFLSKGNLLKRPCT